MGKQNDSMERQLDRYTQALQDHPSAQLYGIRGLLYTRLRRFAEAQSDFDQALHMEPQNAKVHLYCGMNFAIQEQYDHAHANYLKAASLDPQSDEILYILSTSYAHFGQVAEAAQGLEAAIRHNPKWREKAARCEDFLKLLPDPQIAALLNNPAPFPPNAPALLVGTTEQPPRAGGILGAIRKFAQGLRTGAGGNQPAQIRRDPTGGSTDTIPQLEAAVAVARQRGDHAAEGRGLFTLGIMHHNLGDMGAAITAFEQALPVFRTLRDRQGEAAILGNLGSACYSLGDLRAAIGYQKQSLALNRAISNPQGVAASLNNLGLAYADLGDGQQAIDYCKESLDLSRALGDRAGEAGALGNLGLGYVVLGDAQQARSYHEQHLALTRATGDRHGEAKALGNLGSVYVLLEDWQTARSYHEQHLALARATGDRHSEANALNNLGIVYAKLGEIPTAIDYYEQSLLIVQALGNRLNAARTHWRLGQLLEQQGDLARAVALLQKCVEYEHAIGHPNATNDAAYVAALQQRIIGNLPGSPPPLPE